MLIYNEPDSKEWVSKKFNQNENIFQKQNAPENIACD